MPTELDGLSDRYCHIGSQHGRVPTQVQVGRPGNERGVGEVWPNQMKM